MCQRLSVWAAASAILGPGMSPWLLGKGRWLMAHRLCKYQLIFTVSWFGLLSVEHRGITCVNRKAKPLPRASMKLLRKPLCSLGGFTQLNLHLVPPGSGVQSNTKGDTGKQTKKWKNRTQLKSLRSRSRRLRLLENTLQKKQEGGGVPKFYLACLRWDWAVLATVYGNSFRKCFKNQTGEPQKLLSSMLWGNDMWSSIFKNGPSMYADQMKPHSDGRKNLSLRCERASKM